MNSDIIVSIEIGAGITSIGNNAFAFFTNATGVSFPSSGLTTIGNYAFIDCGFTSINMPDTITTIGESAFQDCRHASYLHISDNANSIGNYAFRNCGISSVSFPYSLTSISRGMFYDCSNLSYIYLSSEMTSIGESAFESCPNLQSVYLTEKLKTIGNKAFKNTGLQSITLTRNVTSIGAEAFYGCSKLDQISTYDNNKLATIGANAFYGCSKVTEITLPASVTSIAANAFSGCSILETVTINADPAKLTWGASANDFIPNKGTECIVPSRYYNGYISKFSTLNLQFKSSFIADGVCGENLTWMLDGDGTMVISGYGPMYDYSDGEQPWTGYTDKITSIVFDAEITSIGSCAFYNCYKLENIVVPEGVYSIGDYAFYNCNVLKTAVLPGTLHTIGASAFEDCRDLQQINLPEGLEYIYAYAFNSCDSLKTITIPGGLSTWGEYSFQNCRMLQSVTIRDGITSIPTGAFYECSNLSEVSLADSITSIGEYAFYVNYDYDYGKITSLILPGNLSSLGTRAFYGQGLRSITIPGSLDSIPGDAFEGCGSLNSITILSGTTCIEDGAFSSCEMIKSVTIPSTVTYIGYRAFYEGYYLEDIYLYSDPARLSYFSCDPDYSNVNSNTKIHVLETYLDAYKAKFSNIADLFVGDLDPSGEGQIDLGTGIHLYGYNLSLAGDIGVNFWFKIDEDYLDPDNYILFTVNGQEQKVKISEATTDSESGAKIFRCNVVAKQMSDTITAQLYLANGFPDGTVYSYSIKEYANYILTHNYTDKQKNIAKTMLNYGACAQKYFNYHSDSPANSVLPVSERNVEIKNYTDIQKSSGLPVNIQPAIVSLVLNTKISLKLYFHPADLEGLTVKYQGKTLEKTTNGEFVCVKIDNIYVGSLTSPVGIQFFNASNTFVGQTQYCPSQYIRLVLSQPEDDPVYTDDLKRLVSALYDFNSAIRG